MPVGVSFFGRAWSEPTLIKIAYAFEQADAGAEGAEVFGERGNVRWSGRRLRGADTGANG